ncbi:MAG: hypothetical protein K2K84_07520 [Muribaculaceae bacterium]|nr:hypothetical protein [Muribaculaceae bacterium]
MKYRRLFAPLFAIIVASMPCIGGNPMATDYTPVQCEGSLTPYPGDVKLIETPDSLTPVYVSHVGRHGARYPAGSLHCLTLDKALRHADSIGTITPLGRELLKLNSQIIAASDGRWGALDSLGMAEQRGIAERMVRTFPELLKGEGTVNALSSYSPRSMMSMFSFVHQMDQMSQKMTYLTSTGRLNSPLMRPFDVDEDYIRFRTDKVSEPVYEEYFNEVCPLTAITRVLGRDYPFGSTEKARDLAINEYYVIAGLSAMSMKPEMSKYFTPTEMNALWSCFNLRQYLQRTATTVSTIPADIASALVLDIVNKMDKAATGENPAVADLRFGHAETVMPLVSLLRFPGCYYMTNYFDTVAKHWRDFEVVPMAANVQFILFKSKKTGNYYVRTELNENPLQVLPNDTRIYVPWGELRRYMMNLLPLHLQ